MSVNLATSTIVDQAITELELDPISSFGDDSDLARDVRAKYPGALKFCFEAEDWSFASTIVGLPPAVPATPPADDPNLVALYTLPADCVRVREMLDRGVAWRQDAGFLRADQADGLKIRYTRLIENEDRLPESFADLVALRLAVKLAPRYLQTRTKRSDLFSLFERALIEAKSGDRINSSGRRWDGRDMVSDWASEAVR